MPAVGRALLALHRRNMDAMQRLESIALQLSDGRTNVSPLPPMAFERVRDFFFTHQNYFDAVDRTAEALSAEASTQGIQLTDWLIQRLLHRHGVRVIPSDEDVDTEWSYQSAKAGMRYEAHAPW